MCGMTRSVSSVRWPRVESVALIGERMVPLGRVKVWGVGFREVGEGSVSWRVGLLRWVAEEPKV